MRLRVEESSAGACGQFELFGSALADTFRITISPDRWWENGLVTLIDEIAHRLTNQMVGNSEGRQAGINFAHQLDPEQLLRHVPAPRARVAPTFRRPGLKKFHDDDTGFGSAWHWRFPGATD